MLHGLGSAAASLFNHSPAGIAAADAAAAFKGSHVWSDLGTIETYPVMETDAVMAAIAGK